VVIGLAPDPTIHLGHLRPADHTEEKIVRGLKTMNGPTLVPIYFSPLKVFDPFAEIGVISMRPFEKEPHNLLSTFPSLLSTGLQDVSSTDCDNGMAGTEMAAGKAGHLLTYFFRRVGINLHRVRRDQGRPRALDSI